jgi:hypothetical protein
MPGNSYVQETTSLPHRALSTHCKVIRIGLILTKLELNSLRPSIRTCFLPRRAQSIRLARVSSTNASKSAKLSAYAGASSGGLGPVLNRKPRCEPSTLGRGVLNAVWKFSVTHEHIVGVLLGNGSLAVEAVFGAITLMSRRRILFSSIIPMIPAIRASHKATQWIDGPWRLIIWALLPLSDSQHHERCEGTLATSLHLWA